MWRIHRWQVRAEETSSLDVVLWQRTLARGPPSLRVVVVGGAASAGREGAFAGRGGVAASGWAYAGHGGAAALPASGPAAAGRGAAASPSADGRGAAACPVAAKRQRQQ